ncbi:MAG: hypothetical protein AAF630_03725 [Cyanobacteria bacterium P01_C01_bin.38]
MNTLVLRLLWSRYGLIFWHKNGLNRSRFPELQPTVLAIQSVRTTAHPFGASGS